MTVPESPHDWHTAMHVNELVALRRVAALNPNAAMVRRGPWLLLDAATPAMPAFSVAAPVDVSPSSTNLQLAGDWFAARDAGFRFLLRSDRDASLIAAMRNRGLTVKASQPAMLMELDGARPPASADVAIRRVTSDQDLQRYGPIGWRSGATGHIGIGIARTARELGFEMFLGLSNGQAVASSMAVITDNLVGIYNVSVAPPFRRRGFGAAMTWVAIRAGSDRGATAAFLTSTPMSHALYQRMGFRDRYTYQDLVKLGSPPA